MRTNELATEAVKSYRERPWHGTPEVGFMYGGFMISRDSDPLETSNYRTAAQAYRDEGIDPSPTSMNHWAVGWVEFLDVPLTVRSVAVLADLGERIENYPVLDDEDFSQAEWDSDHPGDGHCYSEQYSDDDPCPCGLPRW